MKSFFFACSILIMCTVLSGAKAEKISNVENKSVAGGSTTPAQKILIVYLSRTKNTKAIAEIIKANVGGNLVAIEPEKPYPENYQATVA